LYTTGKSDVQTTGAHGFRVALDFFYVENSKTAYPAQKMIDAAAIAERLGFEWGGRWKKPDPPHLQMLGGLTLAQYRRGMRPEWWQWPPKPVTDTPDDKSDDTEDEDVKRYNTLGEIAVELGNWAFETINKLVEKGHLKGDERGNLNLSEDMIRMFVILDRAGAFD